jgi:hypothetical protein
MQTFGAFVCVILIFVVSMWLRHWFYAGGTRRVPSDRAPVDSAPINLNAAQYERLDWELKHRGFTPADIGMPYTDFLFANEVMVEVMPASVGSIESTSAVAWPSPSQRKPFGWHAALPEQANRQFCPRRIGGK